jgi:excisionase family DNA binding protein
MTDSILSVDEVRARLPKKTSRKTIYALIHNQELKAKRVGNAYWIYQSWLHEFMANPEPANTRR